MKFFSLDGPIFRIMEKIADLFIVNLLTLFLMAPVITGGAALTAACKVMQNMVTNNEQPVFKTYFKTFASEFKHATLAWLITLVLLAILIYNVTVVYMSFAGNLQFLLYIMLAVASVVFLGTGCYVFPMIARYENTFKQHLRNALLLAMANLPKTILMLAMYLAPVIIALLSIDVFFRVSIFWLMIGIGLTVYTNAKLMQPIFQKLEEPEESSETQENE